MDFTAGPNVNRALSPEARLALFHIAQEALSNAAKHSRASSVLVTLTASDDSVQFSIKDNGQGFESHPAQQRLGHGLSNMQERVKALGGRLSIASSAGEGTEVSAIFPR